MLHLSNVTDVSFRQDVLEAEALVLVDFWAVWSGASRAMTPHLQALAEAYEGRLRVYKLNIDDNKRTPLTYQIRSIPTLLLFKDGQVIDQMTSIPRDHASLASFVDRHLGPVPSRPTPSRAAEHEHAP